MFTGIIEETGSIRGIRSGAESAVLIVECGSILDGTRTGDSISVNGVCLTVTYIGENCFEADVMPETIRATNLKRLKPGDPVNLERAMRADGRFGGHIVSGHIDGTGVIKEVKKEDNAVWLTVETETELLKYIMHKGSIAVDGISLTVQQVRERDFKVAVIPHTRDYTTLQDRKAGYVVNLECDIIGKYVERLLSWNSAKGRSGITMQYLLENGF
ncbi:MAG TPA: riboflavin synthase [Clostridia bacterium]|nr:riboflavin synthase [Clostridia bacterium]